ncbi:MAG: hypothetical protein ACRDJW_00395 [Thermomicrobiales bacterium]
MTIGVRQVIVTVLCALLAVAGAAGVAAQGEATPAASDCAATEPSGLIVYQAWNEADASLTGEVVVADPAGEELHRVSVPGLTRVWSTPMPGRALVTDEQDRLHLLDAEAGTVTALALPEGGGNVLPTGGPAFSHGQGTRYVLLSNARQDQAALVDLETGTATDLVALTGEEFVVFGMISADDSHAAVTFGDSAYLIPTANPASFRKLGGDLRGGNAVLSPDSESVVHYQQAGEDRFELVVEDLDGSNSQVVVTHDTPPAGQFAGSSERLLVRTIDELLVIDLTTGDERQLLDEYVMPWIIAPDGDRVLVASGEEVLSETDLDGAWVWIDIDTGEMTVIEELDNHRPVRQGGDLRWIVLVGHAFYSGQGGEEDLIYGVDLMTGDVQELFAAPPDESYAPPSIAVPDGRYALLLYVGLDDDSRLYLLDAAAGTARVVAEGVGVRGGAISPDGCWITVETTTESGEGRTSSIAIQPIAGGEARTVTNSGFQAVWLALS